MLASRYQHRFVAIAIALVCSFLWAPVNAKTVYCPGYPSKCFDIPVCTKPACDGTAFPCCFYDVQAAAFPSTVQAFGFLEVPENGSSALGYGVVVVNTDVNTLVFDISHNVAQEVAAHIHGFAGPGTNGGVLFPLPLGTHKVGTWNYPESAEANILAGLTYINIHSTSFPGGEIRGQVEPPLPAASDAPSPEDLQPPVMEAGPNPFTTTTDIRYSLDAAGLVSLVLYDAGGRQVRLLEYGMRLPGEYMVDWDGADDQGEQVGSGVYFARLNTNAGASGLRLVRLAD
jgi:hypothetical protein